MKYQKNLDSSPGLFGQISVNETFFPSVRLMKINNEIEGQVFTSPNASAFSSSCSIDAPGAVSASRYLYAFIIAAWQFSTERGLVLGLGAGAGVVMLLTLFPNLSLTVIEIDPCIIQLSRKYFPLLSFYEDQGRLVIVESDAEIYLDHCQDSFAFTLLDLFSGDEENHHNLGLIAKALKLSPYFMANIIASKTALASIERALNLNDAAILMWLAASPAISSEKINWIMTNISSISPEIQEYTLFSDIASSENIMTANEYFNYILSQVHAACFYR